MKIAVASSGLGHVSRGIEAWAADLGRGLVERGVRMRLYKGGGRAEGRYEAVIPCWRRESAEAKRLLDVLPRRFFWRLGLASGYQIEQTTFAMHLLGYLRRERIDLLHVQDPILASIVQRARRFGWVGSKVILADGTSASAAFLRKIQYVQHLAPWHLEEARRAGVWKPTWTAIPNFIDTSQFNPAGGDLRAELDIPRDAIVVLTVAAIKRDHKRVDYLIDEFARLRESKPDAPLWLIVAGGWEAQTDELVRWGTERLGERVRFLVKFPRERMPELYRTANLFVLCSLMEMMPIALLEATASGLPCLVNRHPVLQWMTGSGGEAIDMQTRGELAEALKDRALGASWRQKYGDEARRHCVATFGRDRVINQIMEYYQRVMM